MSSCNCEQTVVTSPSGEQLPSVEDACAIQNPQRICKTCPSDDEALRSDTSDGTSLANSWLDAQCRTENLTILARVGNKLSRFTGTGFIALEAGIARVVANVPLKALKLWHRWWKPTSTSSPILGEPLDYPYMTIADAKGNIHAISGPDGVDASPVWNGTTREFTQKPLSENTLPRKGPITCQTDLELVGYAPIAEGGDPDTVRQMRALEGEGLVYLEEQATVDDSCDCAEGSGSAHVAKTLEMPVPAGAEVYILKYSTALGLHWALEE